MKTTYLVIMCGLFTDVVHSSDCTASRCEMNRKKTAMYVEVVVAWLKYPEKIEENHQNLRNAGVQVDILTRKYQPLQVYK